MKKISGKLLIGCLIGVVIAALIFIGYSFFQNKGNVSEEQIKQITTDYIKTQVNGQTVTANVLGKEYDLYKLEVTIADQKMTVYATLDGTKLFPTILEMKKAASTTTNNKAATEVQKSDKPKVELFVMSHCPYGTQIEKGIIPAIEALGNSIDFELKFCNYSMHGEKELKEQLTQYCIQKEQKDKLLAYLKCFLKDENSSAACVKSSGIDNSKLQSCIASADSDFKVTENFKNNVGYVGQYPGFSVFADDNTKYSVQGSPTLVINGAQAQAGRDSNSLLTSICSAFNNAPESCKSQLSSSTPSAGFGEGTTTNSSTDAGCGQ